MPSSAHPLRQLLWVPRSTQDEAREMDHTHRIHGTNGICTKYKHQQRSLQHHVRLLQPWRRPNVCLATTKPLGSKGNGLSAGEATQPVSAQAHDSPAAITRIDSSSEDGLVEPPPASQRALTHPSGRAPSPHSGPLARLRAPVPLARVRARRIPPRAPCVAAPGRRTRTPPFRTPATALASCHWKIENIL